MCRAWSISVGNISSVWLQFSKRRGMGKPKGATRRVKPKTRRAHHTRGGEVSAVCGHLPKSPGCRATAKVRYHQNQQTTKTSLSARFEIRLVTVVYQFWCLHQGREDVSDKSPKGLLDIVPTHTRGSSKRRGC